MDEGVNFLGELQLAWAAYQTKLDALVKWLCGRTGCREDQALAAIDALGVDVDVEDLISHINNAMVFGEHP